MSRNKISESIQQQVSYWIKLPNVLLISTSFVYQPPSNEFADALRAGSPRKEAHQAGANSKSPLKWTARELLA
jgi:hypothetical protein